MFDRPDDPDEARWQIHASDPALVSELAHHLKCPAAIAHLLVARDITTVQVADRFFDPSLDDLHAPDLLLGLPAAVTRIQQAIADRAPILIYGDYDVDGTIATVLLKTAIDRITPSQRQQEGTSSTDISGSLVTWHVPHRIREGYGIQSTRLAEAHAAGIRLVISVDTGIRAFAAAAEAKHLGLDLIITDHHLPEEAAAGVAALPEALSVINPAQPNCPYPYKHLCGAAVAFKLAHALLLDYAKAQQDSASALHQLKTRLLPSFLKLVAIATIADAVPLTGENRVLATLGLRGLGNPVQPGLRELFRVADIPPDRAPTATEVGFRIGPRINAAGRMDVADDVIELFLTRSPERARALAGKLNTLNQQRRETEREALDEIELRLLDLITPGGSYPPETIVLEHAAWHRGVLGILASRVVERTGRPALILSHENAPETGAPGQAHGSGRSVHGFHLLEALSAVHAAAGDHAPAGSLFTRFGGHAHAVGFSLPSPNVDLLRTRLRMYSSSLLTSGLLARLLVVDAEISPDGLTFELCDWLGRCAPFGNGNAEPVFLARSLHLAAPIRLIKDVHVCLTLVPAAPGLPALQAMGWSRRTDWSSLCRTLNLQPGSRVDAAFHVRSRHDQWFDGLELDLLGLRLSG